MNRLFCFFTGGHRYAEKNLDVVEINHYTDTVRMRNCCVKCGKPLDIECSYTCMFGDIDAKIKRRHAKKAVSDMARYIDADELIRLIEIDVLCQGDYFSKRDAIGCVKAINTADVVPKSEVEKRYHEYQTIKDYIIDLLVEFDEMGFVPMTTVPCDPEEYARAWKEKLIKALEGEHIK